MMRFKIGVKFALQVDIPQVFTWYKQLILRIHVLLFVTIIHLVKLFKTLQTMNTSFGAFGMNIKLNQTLLMNTNVTRITEYITRDQFL